MNINLHIERLILDGLPIGSLQAIDPGSSRKRVGSSAQCRRIAARVCNRYCGSKRARRCNVIGRWNNQNKSDSRLPCRLRGIGR